MIFQMPEVYILLFYIYLKLFIFIFTYIYIYLKLHQTNIISNFILNTGHYAHRQL